MPTKKKRRHTSHKRAQTRRKRLGAKGFGQSSTEGDDAEQQTKEHTTLVEDLPFLKKMAYGGRELAEALRKNAETSIFIRLTSPQLKLLGDLKEDALTASSLSSFLHRYMVVIDNAFFFGAVRPILNGFVVYSEESSQAGFYRRKDHTIHMNVKFCSRNGDFPQRRYLETLTHEMLHAFLQHYTCRCKKCEQKVGNAGILGATGHGPVWANAMIGIQKAMARDLKWEVNCNIETSVTNEMIASGWKPRHDQLVRWECKNLAEKEQAIPIEPQEIGPKKDSSKKSHRKSCCPTM